MVGEDCTEGMEAVKARKILAYFESFEFVFMTRLLFNVLGHTHNLSRCFRIFRDDFMANAIDLIGLSKNQLYKLCGNEGWETLLKDVTSFCVMTSKSVIWMIFTSQF